MRHWSDKPRKTDFFRTVDEDHVDEEEDEEDTLSHTQEAQNPGPYRNLCIWKRTVTQADQWRQQLATIYNQLYDINEEMHHTIDTNPELCDIVSRNPWVKAQL